MVHSWVHGVVAYVSSSATTSLHVRDAGGLSVQHPSNLGSRRRQEAKGRIFPRSQMIIVYSVTSLGQMFCICTTHVQYPISPLLLRIHFNPFSYPLPKWSCFLVPSKFSFPSHTRSLCPHFLFCWPFPLSISIFLPYIPYTTSKKVVMAREVMSIVLQRELSWYSCYCTCAGLIWLQ